MIMPGAPGVSSGLESNDLDRFINNETARIRKALETIGYPGHELRLPLDELNKRFETAFPGSSIPDKAETWSAARQQQEEEKKIPPRGKEAPKDPPAVKKLREFIGQQTAFDKNALTEIRKVHAAYVDYCGADAETLSMARLWKYKEF
jgi:hypothetical protein